MSHYRIELFGGLHVKVGNQDITQFDTLPCGYLLAYLAYWHHKPNPPSRAQIAEVIWPNVDRNDPPRYDSLNDAVRRLRKQLCPCAPGEEDLFESAQLTLSLKVGGVTTDVDDFETALERAERSAVSLEDRAQYRIQALNLYRGELLPSILETNRDRMKRPDLVKWVKNARLNFTKRYIKTVAQVIRHLTEREDFAAALEHAQNALRFHPDRDIQELADRLKQDITTGVFLSAPPRQSAPVYPANRIDPANSTEPLKRLVTFLMADIEAPPDLQSKDTRLPSMPEHYRGLLREALTRHNGDAVWDQNGSFLMAFSVRSSALNCALECQKAFLALQEDPETSIGIRMALHMEEVAYSDGRYRDREFQRVIAYVMAAHRGQILCSETAAAFLRYDLPPNIVLDDLGHYRLRTGTVAERLYQLAPAHLLARFPGPRYEAVYRSRPPRPLTQFFGREEEIRELQSLLAGDSRLITLTGPAGVGKTRLSLEIVRGPLERYSEAIWFVPLVHLSDAESIATAIRDAMDLPALRGGDPMEQVIHALGDHPSLLVLDTFEHLLKTDSDIKTDGDIVNGPLRPDGADIIGEVLQRARNLTCLLTSRRKCNLAGERVFTLAPLPLPQKIQHRNELDIEALRRNECIRLFEDRARAANRTFVLTRDNAPPLVQLCRLLDGIPLAIEVVAAHIRQYPLDSILELVQESCIGDLRNRYHEAGKHHRTLHSTFDWGYRLLSPDLQRFFRHLSVFRGGCTAEAIQSVCADEEAHKLLDELQDWSLVEMHTTHTMNGVAVRYIMLETLRQYAEAKLEIEEKRALRKRHAAFFRAFAQEARKGVVSPHQKHWLGRLEIEHVNLRAALKWAEESDPKLGLEIAISLSQFWEIRSYWSEGYTVLTALLSDTGDGPAERRAQALLAAGNLARMLGKKAEARGHLDESSLLCQSLNDRPLLARVLNSLGILTQEEGKAGEACLFYEQSLQIKREHGDPQGIAISLSNLGYAAYYNNDLRSARRFLAEAVQILRTLELKHALANALNNLGSVTLSAGDTENARPLLLESLTMRQEILNKSNIVYSLEEFARLAHAEQDVERAVYLLGAAQRLRERTKTQFSTAEQARHNRFVAELHATLASARFDAAWNRGYTEVLAQVLDDIRDASSPMRT
jgi:non-specific serine/threonine protein kinase